MMQKPITFWSGKLTAAPVPMIASPLKIEPDVALIRMRISYHNFALGAFATQCRDSCLWMGVGTPSQPVSLLIAAHQGLVALAP